MAVGLLGDLADDGAVDPTGTGEEAAARLPEWGGHATDPTAAPRGGDVATGRPTGSVAGDGPVGGPFGRGATPAEERGVGKLKPAAGLGRVMAGDAGVLAPLLPALTVVLIVAHLLGALADRVGFVPVVGELLTGLVLGPSILGVLAPGVAALVVPVPAGLEALSSLGLVLLLVLAGTEVDAAALRESLRPTVALATGAFLVPFAGWGGAGLPPARPVPRGPGFAGSVRTPVGDRTGHLRRTGRRPRAGRPGRDGPAGRPTDAHRGRRGRCDRMDRPDRRLPTRPRRGHRPPGGGRTVLVLAAFGGLVLAVGPAIARSVFAAATRVRSPVLTGFSAVVALGVGAAATALALGLEPILGAFLAGVVVRPALDADSARVFEVGTLGLFAPLFFATAGLRVDLSGVVGPEVLVVGVVTLTVAVAGKALGVAVGTAVTELSAEETVCLAIGLNAREAMEVVVAALGLSAGLFSPTMYAVIVLVAIVTSVVTPPLLRRARQTARLDGRTDGGNGGHDARRSLIGLGPRAHRSVGPRGRSPPRGVPDCRVSPELVTHRVRPDPTRSTRSDVVRSESSLAAIASPFGPVPSGRRPRSAPSRPGQGTFR